MKRLCACLGTLVLFSSLIGCNTFQGIGKDIKKGGEVIEKAAKN
jgi:predicted small secreted protein